MDSRSHAAQRLTERWELDDPAELLCTLREMARNREGEFVGYTRRDRHTSERWELQAGWLDCTVIYSREFDWIITVY